MKISNKASYPYPIWGWRDDYNLATPDYSIDDQKYTDINNYGYELTALNSNADLDQLISEGRAEYICVVDCPSTGKHWFFESNEPQFHFTIPRNEVNKRVEFKWMIISKVAINDFKSQSLNEDYGGHSTFPKGAMLAYITSFEVYPDVTDGVHSLDEIIAVVKNVEDNQIRYKFDRDQILIALPEEQLEFFKKNIVVPEILHSTIVFTAIVLALARIHKADDSLDWVNIIKQYIEPLQASEEIPSLEDLDEDEDAGYNVEQCVKITNYILQDPYMRMFKSLKKETDEFEKHI